MVVHVRTEAAAERSKIASCQGPQFCRQFVSRFKHWVKILVNELACPKFTFKPSAKFLVSNVQELEHQASHKTSRQPGSQ